MSISLFLFSAVIALLSCFVYKFKQNLRYWQSRGIACEDPHWFFGNFKGLRTEFSFFDISRTYYEKFKGTGPFAGFYWFQKPAVFVLDTSLVKNILIKDFPKFTDRGLYANEKDDPLSATLFTLDGHKWKTMRNQMTPTFTSAKMKSMFPTVLKVGQMLVNTIDNIVKQGAVHEVKDVCGRYTMDVIGTCAFGIDCSSLNDPKAEFHKMCQQSFVDRRHNAILFTFMNLYPKLARRLRMKKTPDHIEEFFMRIVKNTVDQREKLNIRRNDFMDMLIDLKNNKVLKSEDGEVLRNLNLGEVAAQAFVFLIAGFETSSSTMSFALYELAQHEDIQQKARIEINTVFENHGQQFTYECMKDMQYLDQIIAETLRLYTVLPLINRLCLEDYVVPGHPKYVIKKGMNILIPAAGLHRDPAYYPNPDAFNPENFSAELVKQRESVEWLPFGDGPRNCIGMRFGKMETRIGLALLLKHYKFSVCSQTQIPLVFNKKTFITSTEAGIHLKIEKL